LKPGDVIRAINGQKIVSSGDLPAIVGLAAPGAKVSLEVWRQGKPVQIAATLGNADDKVAAVGVDRADQASAKLPSWACRCVRWIRWKNASPAFPAAC
jgi:serine protease Do